MSEMIERVAKAVQKRRYELAMEAIGGGRVGIGNDDRACREIARAAIEAMREPSDRIESRVAAILSMADPDERGLPAGETMRSFYGMMARVAVSAMIDAALAEGTEAAQVDGEGGRG